MYLKLLECPLNVFKVQYQKRFVKKFGYFLYILTNRSIAGSVFIKNSLPLNHACSEGRSQCASSADRRSAEEERSEDDGR